MPSSMRCLPRTRRLVQRHPAAAATIPANFVRNGFLPFHDGATRWYRDLSDVIMGD